MGTRGRTSAAALQVVERPVVEAIERATVPDELTDEQAEIWHQIVNRMPADWFPIETRPLLAQYCRHVIAARRVADMIVEKEREKTLEIDALDRLYKMQEREGRAMSSLATRMRLTQQTTYDKSKKKGSQVKRPWD